MKKQSSLYIGKGWGGSTPGLVSPQNLIAWYFLINDVENLAAAGVFFFQNSRSCKFIHLNSKQIIYCLSSESVLYILRTLGFSVCYVKKS